MTSSFSVYELVGVSESNTFVGSTRMLGRVYRRLELKPGDELHLLPGGDFVLVDGEAKEFALEISEKHSLEKVYLPRKPELPLEHLSEIPKEQAAQAKYRSTGDAVPLVKPGHFVGRSIDSIVED